MHSSFFDRFALWSYKLKHKFNLSVNWYKFTPQETFFIEFKIFNRWFIFDYYYGEDVDEYVARKRWLIQQAR